MSTNVNYALQTARESGMLTIGFAGKDGGRTKDIAEYCLTVPSFSIHRIQEVHTTLLHVLWDMVHVLLGEEDII
jgi:D-sedoheptulose 7-phosphate isomerase